MRGLLLILLLAVLPARAAMDITRELVAPDNVVPGQPLRVAVTFWTDTWFNPPPQWPAFVIENGSLLTTPLPNQLLSRHKDGTSWSGIRLERQVMAWDQGVLRLPETEVTLTSPGQPPVTVPLPALEKPVNWPQDTRQPDRFLPASHLTLSQKITQFHAADDQQLHAGDVIERAVTVQAGGIVANQIPRLLYAIPGTETQGLPAENQLLTRGRGDVEGAQRTERLRYLPSQAGTVTLPPVQLRWWDTGHQQWQLADLPGASFQVAAARGAGSEAALRGTTGEQKWRPYLLAGAAVILVIFLWFSRRLIARSCRYLARRWHRFWHPVPLPDLSPVSQQKNPRQLPPF
ncbi:BatD family protein [Rahnella victoriana]|uniref:BatD family protein n=1 Tax=Rahnella victoriana TaxID=1510570 RepID=UPI00103AE12C|nr:BatD family protein [Rahnella victoriana]TBX34411.1 oxygen tolerance domain protein [Rahnella victoriana]